MATNNSTKVKELQVCSVHNSGWFWKTQESPQSSPLTLPPLETHVFTGYVQEFIFSFSLISKDILIWLHIIFLCSSVKTSWHKQGMGKGTGNSAPHHGTSYRFLQACIKLKPTTYWEAKISIMFHIVSCKLLPTVIVWNWWCWICFHAEEADFESDVLIEWHSRWLIDLLIPT